VSDRTACGCFGERGASRGMIVGLAALIGVPSGGPKTCAALGGIGGPGVLDAEDLNVGMLMPNIFFLGLLDPSSGFFSAGRGTFSV
jgi:hypothetical protein